MTKQVVVIGGGAIGLFVARSLAARGHAVTLMDSGVPGAGASDKSAGWICPGLAVPLAAPGVTWKSIKWMAQADSPLYIAPRPRFSLASWIFHFWKHCNWADFSRAKAALRYLDARTAELFDDLSMGGDALDVRRGDILMLYLKDVDLDRDARELGESDMEPLDLGQLRKLEPALTQDVVGGFGIRNQRYVDPSALIQWLLADLKRKDVSVIPSQAVLELEQEQGAVNVLTASGRVRANAVVIAAGVWTRRIALSVGVKLPIEAGKGYRLDYAPSPVSLRHPLHLNEGKVAVSPFGNWTRLAGTMEFSGINDNVSEQRASAIARSMARYVEGWPTDLKVCRVASGLRPMTPDSLPIIGRLPGCENLFVATGHGMYGIDLAPGTAEALAEYVDTGRRPDVLEPFDPGRFA